MGKLNASQIASMTDMLTDSLGEFDLETITHVATGDQLFVAYTSNNLPRKRQVRDLLLALEQDGTTDRFLGEVWRRKPNRGDVREAIVTLFPHAPEVDPTNGPLLSLQHGGKADATATPFALAPGLQKNVKPHLGMLDLGTWPEELIARRRRICKVEVAGLGSGTGVLVGRSTVLTNWHVVKDVLAAPHRVACRFDFQTLAGGETNPGTVVKLGPRGVLDNSPCSQAELTTNDPDHPPPDAGQLDYALMELAEPVGDERGFEKLPEFAPHVLPGSALLILQHPNGERIKLALDTEAVIGRVNDDLRLRYKTNTEAGASGSPVYTMDWEFVALHHLGDPAFRTPSFNQGIPIELIRARIVGNGHSAAIGAG
ncbi:Exfoliative toxin ExhB [Neorhizobium galegae bv. orientalis]|nr:Exfoliative toxin ExhB [Neorhizobium galegae bv. orientalis]